MNIAGILEASKWLHEDQPGPDCCKISLHGSPAPAMLQLFAIDGQCSTALGQVDTEPPQWRRFRRYARLDANCGCPGCAFICPPRTFGIARIDYVAAHLNDKTNTQNCVLRRDTIHNRPSSGSIPVPSLNINLKGRTAHHLRRAIARIENKQRLPTPHIPLPCLSTRCRPSRTRRN